MGTAQSSSPAPSREFAELESIVFGAKKLKAQAKKFKETLSPKRRCQFGQVEFCPQCNNDLCRYLHLVDCFAREQDRIIDHFRAIFQERGWDDGQLIAVVLRNQDRQKRALLETKPREGVTYQDLPDSSNSTDSGGHNHHYSQAISETSVPDNKPRFCHELLRSDGEDPLTTPLSCGHIQEEVSTLKYLAKSFATPFGGIRRRKLNRRHKINHLKGRQMSRCLNKQNRNHSHKSYVNLATSSVRETTLTTQKPAAPAITALHTSQPLQASSDTNQVSRNLTAVAEASLVSLDCPDQQKNAFPSLSLTIQFKNGFPVSKPHDVALPLSCSESMSSAQHTSIHAIKSAKLDHQPLINPPPRTPKASQSFPSLLSSPAALSSSNQQFPCKCQASLVHSSKLYRQQTQSDQNRSPSTSTLSPSAASETPLRAPPLPPVPETVLSLMPPLPPPPPPPIPTPHSTSPPPPPPPTPPPPPPSPHHKTHSGPPPPPPLPSQLMSLVPRHGGPPPPPLPGFKNFTACSTLPSNLKASTSLPINSPVSYGVTAVPEFCRSLPRPSTKMKRLPWKKFNLDDVRNSIWKNVGDILDSSSSSIDCEMIEHLFGQTVLVKRDSIKGSAKSLDRESVASFLDSKTSLNLSVALKSFKMSPIDVAGFIKDCNMTELQPDRLRALAKVLPDDDKVATAREFAGSRARLSAAELFCLELTKMPLFRLRVQAMIQADEILPSIHRLQADFELLLRVGNDILNSDSIRHFLSRILELGNFLNTDSYAGDAAGFHLQNLEVVWTTRANNSHVTLLNYLVENEKPDGEVLSFSKQLKDLRIAVRLSVSELIQEVDTLEKNVTNITQRLQMAPNELRAKFQDFVSHSAESIATIETLVGRVEDLRCQLATYFCEKQDKYRIEDCIAIFHTLCSKIEAIHEEKALKLQQEQQRQLRLQLSAERRQKESFVEGSTQVTPNKAGRNMPRSKASLQKALLEQRGKTGQRDQLMNEIARGDFKLRKTPGSEDVLDGLRAKSEDCTFLVTQRDGNYHAPSQKTVARRLLGTEGFGVGEQDDGSSMDERSTQLSGFHPIDEDKITSGGRIPKTIYNVQEDPSETVKIELDNSQNGNRLTPRCSLA